MLVVVTVWISKQTATTVANVTKLVPQQSFVLRVFVFHVPQVKADAPELVLM